nr:hypothetical protein [Candidatus Sigynarchaeota archaeon]
MEEALLGTWKSGMKSLDVLALTATACIVDGDRGRWSSAGDEIWLLRGDGKTGTKWTFSLGDNGTLTFSQPEDFTYLGHGEYMYFQMTPPGTTVVFHRIA